MIPLGIATSLGVSQRSWARKLGCTGLTDEQEELANALHNETETALQIILTCQTFEPGEFKKTSH